MKNWILILSVFLSAQSAVAQNNTAVSMSELLAYNVRFNPADQRQLEIIKTLKPTFLIQQLKTDVQKNAFWLNIYNSMMMMHLKDTNYQGVFTNFYKIKNTVIAGKSFSLFEIEHEFLLAGKKMRKMGFKKSKLDTNWIKLRPTLINPRVVFCMYRGLYGYPPFQVIENGQIDQAFEVGKGYCIKTVDNQLYILDWVKKYKKVVPEFEKVVFNTEQKIIYTKTPEAVYIKSFYPVYEGVKFKEEEKNPWLK